MSKADFSGRTRLDACPGALQVHEAADGPLARVRLPGGAIPARRLAALAACAGELGSGVIELTSRANVQVRGLRSATAFADRIAAAGLLPSPSHERVRNIVASPLSGRGPAGVLDPYPLVEALDLALCARPRLAGLPGRFLFAVDDGTGDVEPLGADVTFAPGRLLLAGVDTGLSVRADEAVLWMIAAAEAFLDERESTSSERDRAAWRIGELPDGPARIAARIRARLATTTEAPPTAGVGTTTTGTPANAAMGVAPAAPARHVGRIGQRDGRTALEAVIPLGRLSAAQARTLADVATEAAMRDESAAGDEAAARDRPAGEEETGRDGAVPVRLTPWRTALLLDLSPATAEWAARQLAKAGLETDPATPWAGVSACTGRPGCGKALADVQEDARHWVAARHEPPATPVHWAGCERRCGLPRGPVVQMIATGDGYEERRQ